MSYYQRALKPFVWFALVLILAVALIGGAMVIYLQQNLTDVNELKEMQLQVPLRIYSQDNQLIAEFGEKKRIPVPLNEIPPALIHAVLATEDSRFYQHTGVDFFGLSRAALRVLITGHAEQGGSTITMQVARNFFLTPKKTMSRKIEEILLAIKIDKELSKEKILELYLNKIYFGNRAYGVAAAARVYFGKSLQELSLPEMALIAGLPKAPSALNPLVNPEGAKNRRDHVLRRMYEQDYIDKKSLEKALATPVEASYHNLVNNDIKAPYVAEMVRQALVTHYGEDVYTQGLQIYTTIDSRLQEAANNAVKQGLLAYDKRHGFRGPVRTLGDYDIDSQEKWLKKLQKMSVIENAYPAAIMRIHQGEYVKLLLADKRQILVPWSHMTWNGRVISGMKEGWVVYMLQNTAGEWVLTQLPEIEGALVALNPNNGGILALVGGYNFELSKFNRATQAERQPGSSFKPFIYAAALALRYNLASIINDAPIVVNTPGSPDLWRPQNDQKEFSGPTRLRLGLVHSLNLVSIRLLDAIGIDYALSYIKNFGFDVDKLPATLSLALGTGSITPLQQTAAFAVFANGGYRVNPYVIDHIVDAHGKTIYQMGPQVVCATCADITADEAQNSHNRQAPRVISAKVAYLITSALQNAIQSGTAFLAHSLQRPDLAGKTGTTSDYKDTWFVGFNADIVATVWAGFDQPVSLHEYSNQMALPMWIDFMRQILNKYPPHAMPKPPGIVTLTIDKTTGLRSDGFMNTISEIFDEEHTPSTHENSDTGTFVDPDTGIDHTFHPTEEVISTPAVEPSVD